jgi:hypothetical protein
LFTAVAAVTGFGLADGLESPPPPDPPPAAAAVEVSAAGGALVTTGEGGGGAALRVGLGASVLTPASFNCSVAAVFTAACTRSTA